MIAITFSNLTSLGVAALMRCYEAFADSGGVHMDASGTDYLGTLDSPADGVLPAKAAFAPFNRIAVDAPAAAVAEVAAAFAKTVAVPVMTEKATLPYEEYIKSNWTDALLIEHGYMVAPPPNSHAAPSTAGVDPVSTALAGQHAISTETATVAPPPAPTSVSSGQTVADPAQPRPPALLDKDGFRWDARIHAGTRSQNKDATWKKKKGVEPGLVAQVEAEQRAEMAGGAPAQAAHTALNAAPPPPPSDAARAAIADALAAARAAAPPPPPGNAAPPPPPGNAAPPPPPPNGAIVPPTNFVDLCKYATGIRKFKPEQIFKVCEMNGLVSLGQVNGNEHLIPKMFADFEALR